MRHDLLRKAVEAIQRLGLARAKVHVQNHPVDPQLDPAELAALTAIAGVVMNLDEVLTKE